MYKSLSPQKKWIIKGIPILFIISACIHSSYKLLEGNKIAAAFLPMNESIWEHLKMILLPIILWWSIYYLVNSKRYNINKKKWFTGALVSLIVSLITIPLIYYFYTGAFGVQSIIMDIILLFLSILFGQLLGLYAYTRFRGINANFCIVVFIALILIFVLCTYFTLKIPIFMDSATGKYGM